MYSIMKLCLSLSLFFGGINVVIGSKQVSPPKTNSKLFVIGDFYGDTGNMNPKKPNAMSWKSPYGITYPGKPSGRYSDGLTATDFLGKVLGAKDPYLWRTHERSKKRLQRGMNFAYGGSGAFDSPIDKSPNMSTQVNYLVTLFQLGKVYNFSDVTPSDVALLSYSGNDYIHYIAKNSRALAYQAFVKDVMNTIKQSLWMYDSLKFKTIAVTSLQPIECLPHFTKANSFQRCNESYSKFTTFHNNLLKQVVDKLNEESRRLKKGRRFVIIDLHKAFMAILEKKGNTKFRNLMKPCCEGDCAYLDNKGAKKYTLCDDRKSAFFWDAVNPTHEGWKSIFSILGNPLTESLTKG